MLCWKRTISVKSDTSTIYNEFIVVLGLYTKIYDRTSVKSLCTVFFDFRKEVDNEKL